MENVIFTDACCSSIVTVRVALPLWTSYNCVLNVQMSFVGILNAFILCILFSLN